MKKILFRMALAVVLLLLSIILINSYIVGKSSKHIYRSVDELPEKQAVIVLGAYVRGSRLSDVLEDRVISGLDVFNHEKGSKILLSGDHGQTDYDEVNSMRKYILANDSNIIPEDIFMDHAGFDTYDSMYRARDIFEIESAIIVTQDFHINRAVYIANELGIDAVGYAVNEDRFPASVKLKWRVRETLSRVKAFIDTTIQSKPKYLGHTIPITGDGRLSWDEID